MVNILDICDEINEQVKRLTKRITRLGWAYGYARGWWLHVVVTWRNTELRITSVGCEVVPDRLG